MPEWKTQWGSVLGDLQLSLRIWACASVSLGGEYLPSEFSVLACSVCSELSNSTLSLICLPHIFTQGMCHLTLIPSLFWPQCWSCVSGAYKDLFSHHVAFARIHVKATGSFLILTLVYVQAFLRLASSTSKAEPKAWFYIWIAKLCV